MDADQTAVTPPTSPASYPVAIAIRPAVPEDADAIACIFLESAEHHARLDPERYRVPAVDSIAERYRAGRQHPLSGSGDVVTLVAELRSEIVGFIDARLDQSADAMHREIIYCHIDELAVTHRHRNQGIGRRLLRAVEEWGRRQGAEFAALEYHTANTGAMLFYREQMGYRPASTTVIRNLRGGGVFPPPDGGAGGGA